MKTETLQNGIPSYVNNDWQLTPYAPWQGLTITPDKSQFIHPKQASIITLPIGYANLAQRHIHHSPATPYEIENVIMLVEDEIMLKQKQIDRSRILVSDDAQIVKIAHFAQLGQDSPILLREQVEVLFNRVADLISGRPLAQDPLPMEAPFILTLLILRELLHHLGFERIIVLTAPNG